MASGILDLHAEKNKHLSRLDRFTLMGYLEQRTAQKILRYCSKHFKLGQDVLSDAAFSPSVYIHNTYIVHASMQDHIVHIVKTHFIELNCHKL